MAIMSSTSPRSANYERLEGGGVVSGGSGGGFRQRWFTWKRVVVGMTVLGVVYWLSGGGGTTESSGNVVPGLGGGKIMDLPKHNPSPTSNNGPPKSPQHNNPPSPPPPSPPTHLATSYETDPDPTKTTYCLSPYSPTVPLVQYALMIDAGSTGSRIHIYKFNNCHRSPSYEYEVFKMTQPGLSHYESDAVGAARSLDVLLDEAVRVVPEELRKCTPVQVKATAGLRLLKGEQSRDILREVRERVEGRYPFKLDDKGEEGGGVVVMDGKDEGVYAWITANYLLGTVGGGGGAAATNTGKGKGTYAVLDLGGASTQIVFEPNFADTDAQPMVEGEHKYDLKFSGKEYALYQHSYLGYGLKRARLHVHRLVDFMASLRVASTDAKASEVVGNPCLAKGTTRVVEFKEDETGEGKNVTMGGEEIGSFEACDKVVQLVMAKDSICEVKPCSFNGVYQPSLLDTFPTGKILLLSYFYDRLFPLLDSPPSSSTKSTSLKVSTIAHTARTVCMGPTEWRKRWGHDKTVMEELEGRPEWCLDLTFMHALLRVGYEFGDEREVELGKKIEDTELGWCLGATLALVAGDLKCRV